MAKRFTDTDLWDKEWFMFLTCKQKCLIRFLFDKCDVAGVWSANWILASSYIGEKICEKDLEIFESQIVKISESKFFIKDFITFQYGTLSENCKPHQKILALLKKYKIDLENIIGYGYPLQRVQEEDKEEDKEEEEDKGVQGENNLVPQMLKTFKKSNPDYPTDKQKDFPALLSISKFICEKADVKFNPKKVDCIKIVLQYWTHLCDHIPKDNFFKKYSISQVDKHIQSIILSIQNATTVTSKGKERDNARSEYANRNRETSTEWAPN